MVRKRRNVMAPTRGSTRRKLLQLLGCVAALTVGQGRAQAAPAVKVWKDPSCGCCSGWIEHLRRGGFSVASVDTFELATIKAEAGIPADLASCHTARLEGYCLEGHVPAAAIWRLLQERPEAIGLAVPGMPVGSPGMEGGSPEVYAVILFGKNHRQVYARFVGAEPLIGDAR
jgi:hypothetical protein